MKLYTYQEQTGTEHLAISFEGETLYSLDKLGVHFADMNDLICNGGLSALSGLSESSAAALDRSTIKICASIPQPRQDIICIGINYYEHGVESNRYDDKAFMKTPPKAIYFSKRVNRAVADGETIPRYPDLIEKMDYECELGVILGQDAFQLKPEQVKDYIFGYTIVNDVSARDLQTGHQQWYFGKSLDGFTPIGPCIVPASEISFPPALDIRCTVNGELRQNSNTSLLIHTIADIVAELSRGMTLQAGTIIASGTPAGVGMGMQPPHFLQSGDEIVCEIEKIGTLRNIVK